MLTLTPFERRSFDLFNDFFADNNANNQMSSFKTDIRDTGDKYILDAELPGFNKEEIALDLNGDTLTLTAKHTENKDEKEEGKYIRRERSSCSYSRTFDVSEIDTESIGAEYKNGILTMTMPKKHPQPPVNRRLEIH